MKMRTSINSDSLLIINHLNKVVFADQNGLRLWDSTSADLISKVNLTTTPQNLSHKRTKSAKLVRQENKTIEILTKKMNFSSTVTGSPDVFFLIHPHKNKLPLNKFSSPDKLFSTSDNTFSLIKGKPIYFSGPFTLIKNIISDIKGTTDNTLDHTINKTLADTVDMFKKKSTTKKIFP